MVSIMTFMKNIQALDLILIFNYKTMINVKVISNYPKHFRDEKLVILQCERFPTNLVQIQN